jgi:hypothetical protein
MRAESLTAGPAPGARAQVPETDAGHRRPRRWGDGVIYLLFAALVGVAWQISRMGLIRPNDDMSYWIAVAGGLMMLALFTYPLRKYVGFMRGMGKVKWWFWLHLFLGIAGPWLILVHSTFRIGSLNAGVALFSMGIVVASGVVGRFIYVRVHRGLNGEMTSLAELRQRAGLVESDARSRLHFAPEVEAALLAFEQRELRADECVRQLTAWLLLSWCAAVPAQTLESVLRPGELVQGHAKWEEECTQCHVRFDRAAQDGCCMDCHKDVGQDVRERKAGYHGRLKPQACRSCHTDHKGRDARIVDLDKKSFDHKQTDYVLQGQARSRWSATSATSRQEVQAGAAGLPGLPPQGRRPQGLARSQVCRLPHRERLEGSEASTTTRPASR